MVATVSPPAVVASLNDFATGTVYATVFFKVSGNGPVSGSSATLSISTSIANYDTRIGSDWCGTNVIVSALVVYGND